MQVGFVRKCNQLPPHSSFVGSRWQSVDNPKSLIRPLWRRKLPALSYIWVNEFQNPTLSHLKIHKAHSFFTKSIDISSRARNAHARILQSFAFFAVTSVTQTTKRKEKNMTTSTRCIRRHTIWFGEVNHRCVKIHTNAYLTNWKLSTYSKTVTLVTAKKRKLL